MSSLTSELQAVNVMLGYLGEQPATVITGSSLPLTVTQAVSILDEVSKEIQAEGWFFNREKDVVFTPDSGDSTITLDNDVLSCDSIDGHKDQVVARGLKLYDLKNNTYEFTSDVKVELVRFLAWDYLPEAARRYISIRASRVYQSRMLGSRELEALILRDELLSKSRLTAMDAETSDRTIFDNYDTASRIGINRNYNIS